MQRKQQRDTFYQIRRELLPGFSFDEAVAEVFDDMINRSVPGYAHVTAMSGLLAGQFVQPDTHVYDLGCSLGASLLSVLDQVSPKRWMLTGIDTSPSMLERCHEHLLRAGYADKATLCCEDITTFNYQPASWIMMDPSKRDALIETLYHALIPGGALLVSEKVAEEDDELHHLIDELHLDFKRANGYSDLEISQKRTALENFLVPETVAAHLERFERCGFKHAVCWFRSLNFCSFLAVK
jgi:tRNA (cmo5U34)-methyltransferase